MSPFSNLRAAYRLASHTSDKQKKAQQFKHDLESAQRAEAPVDPHSRLDHEYPHLLNATHGEDMADGSYICACGEENYLYHKTGKYPFEYMRCRMCNRIFDEDCMSTTILVPIPNPAKLPSSGLTQEMAEGMCQICPTCGLSHRVHLALGTTEPDYKIKCHCGAPSTRYWDIYYICGPESYQHDPIAASVALKAKWASRATQNALDGRQTQSAPPSLAVPKPVRSPISKVQTTSSRPVLPTRPYTSVGRRTPAVQPKPKPKPEPSLPPTPSKLSKRPTAVPRRRMDLLE